MGTHSSMSLVSVAAYFQNVSEAVTKLTFHSYFQKHIELHSAGTVHFFCVTNLLVII